MEEKLAWVTLLIAGLFETGWAIGLKYTMGFTRLWPTVWIVASMIISLWLLGIAMKSLPVGTAFAVWARWARSSWGSSFSGSLPIPAAS
jgi:quaternary ammonium compound-resistance protein SugE